ncbi:hypothetical protein BHM03_00035089 [Ensete ventricosum]|nr:hypothetical protein BHM03_00035089 [Ensete ventricosum]
MQTSPRFECCCCTTKFKDGNAHAIYVVASSQPHASEAIGFFLRTRFSGSSDAAAGLSVHGLSVKSGVESSLFRRLGVGLLLHGTVEDIRRMFDGMPEKDAVLWTSMLSGYARNGDSVSALAFFMKMVDGGLQPDHVVVSVSFACCYVSLRAVGIDRAREECARLLRSSVLRIAVAIRQCSYVALKLFDEMCTQGIQPNSVTFLGVLSAKHLAKTGRLVEAERFAAESLANMHADAGRYSDVERVRDFLNERSVSKQIGYNSSVESGELNPELQKHISTDH